MQNEREHEAGNPGPEGVSGDDATPDQLIFETINVTSANTKRQTILKTKAHIQLLQEYFMAPGQSKTIKCEAKAYGKTFDG